MNFICDKCGAGIKFDIDKQKVICEHCGVEKEPNELTYNDDIYMQCERYTCKSCGAEILSSGKVAVIKCVYCGSKEFINGKVNKDYFLEGIIPFKVKKEDFIKSFQEYIRNAENIDPKFQKIFEDVDNINISGLYIPYYFGEGFFDNGYSKEVKELLENIIPFNFKQLEDMNPIYLDNFYAETINKKFKQDYFLAKKPLFYWIPVWFAEVDYKKNNYYIVMNGQTWEMSGYFLKKRRIFDEIKYYILSIISICSGIFISNVSVISKEQRQERNILTLLMFTMGLLFIMLNAGWFDISNIIGKKDDKKRMKFLKKINFFSLPAQQNNIRNELITSDIENKK